MTYDDPLTRKNRLVQGPLSRRSFLRRAAILGLAVPAAGSLLAACGGDDDDQNGEQISGPTSAEQEAEDTATQATADDESDQEATQEDDPGSEPTATGDTGPVADGGTLIVGWDQDILDMDPANMGDALATEVSTKIYSRLVRWETQDFSSFVGDLAESWEVSDDGLEWTFALRENAQWHKGYGEVNAEDVRFSYLRHLDEEVGSRFVAEASPIQDVVADDTYTVRVVLNDPYPDFFPQFVAYRPGFIVNQRALEELGDRYSEEPIGSGPFIFDSWSPEDRIELMRNNAFYGGAAPFSEIHYLIIREPATKEIALERGEIDICYFFEPEIQKRMLEHEEINVDTVVGPRTFYIRINVERPPLDDVRVRQALWYGLDKQLLVDTVLEGFATPTDTLFNPHVFAPLEETIYSYDPERARELLAEAGHSDGIKLKLSTYPPYDQAAQATAMQAMWREIGIDVEIEVLEFAILSEQRDQGNFDLDYGPTLRLGADQYAVLLHSQYIPSANDSRYRNPEVDALIDQARVEPDEEKRRELYYEIQRILQRDAPYIPVMNPHFMLAFRPDIQGARADLLLINAMEMSRSG